MTDALTWLILEDPRPLWVTLGLAEIVLLVAWQRRRSRGLLVAAVAVPLAGLALGAADALVETDGEALRRSVRILKDAAERGQVVRFAERISDRYRAGKFGKDDLMLLADAGLPRVTLAFPTPGTIRMEDGAATVRQGALVRSKPGAEFQIPRIYQNVTWEGRFEPDPDGQWRLVSLMVVRPNRFHPEQFVPLVRRARP